jgi:2-dehydropantoate 2-reductase
MAQDVLKGRRTEIEFINGHIAEASEIGVPAPANARITELVTGVSAGR